MKPAPRSARGRLKEIIVGWDMFNFEITVVIGPHADLPKYLKWRHKRCYKEIPACAAWLVGLYFHAPERGPGVIWLPVVPRTARRIGHMAHEMGHAVMDLVRHANFKINSKTEETICYAIAHGVEQVLEGVRK